MAAHPNAEKTEAAIGPDPACWTVYVLLNGAGVTYTGITKDLGRRLTAHNTGKGARFTRGRGPWRVLYQEGPLCHGDALRRERAIKRDRRFRAGIRQTRSALPDR